jgi:hypothetical protein
MFPDMEYTPTKLAQLAVYASVTGFIRRKFFQPESSPSFRESGMFRARMPETAVNKDDQAMFWKCEVWRAGQSKMSPPAFDASLPKQSRELFLG